MTSMAEIRPFQALRFTEKAGSPADLCCPPYDIISEEQRQGYLARSGNNIIRLELPKGDDPYREAGKTLNQWREEGILATDAFDSIYIYEEEFTVRGERKKVKGFISRVRLTPFSEGVVLPHEETLSKAKEDRFLLMSETFCNFSQIYSLYFDEGNRCRYLIDCLSDCEPDVEFTDDIGVTHRLWAVDDEGYLSNLCNEFKDKKLYIADGHHRYETACNFAAKLKAEGKLEDGGAADYCMMMLVNIEHEGLVVFPTHRIVFGLENFSAEDIRAKLADTFILSQHEGVDGIEPALDALYAQGKKACAMYTGKGCWTLMELKDTATMEAVLPNSSKALRELDVSVLHSLVLEQNFGIDKANMAAQKNLRYTRDLSEALAAVDNGEADCSFILNPTRVEEISAVAAAGEKMPQKSTYFYPKLITGLVMNSFEE